MDVALEPAQRRGLGGLGGGAPGGEVLETGFEGAARRPGEEQPRPGGVHGDEAVQHGRERDERGDAEDEVEQRLAHGQAEELGEAADLARLPLRQAALPGPVGEAAERDAPPRGQDGGRREREDERAHGVQGRAPADRVGQAAQHRAQPRPVHRGVLDRCERRAAQREPASLEPAERDGGAERRGRDGHSHHRDEEPGAEREPRDDDGERGERDERRGEQVERVAADLRDARGRRSGGGAGRVGHHRCGGRGRGLLGLGRGRGRHAVDPHETRVVRTILPPGVLRVGQTSPRPGAAATAH